jgi:hypothetical protein
MKKVTLWAVAGVCVAALGVASAAVGSSTRHASTARSARIARLSRALARSVRTSPLAPLHRLTGGVDGAFTDPSGDGAGGADITGVQVHSESGVVAFLIQLPTTAQLGADDAVTVFFDSDNSSSTGSGGIDYGIAIFGAADGSLIGGVLKWDGSAFTPVDSSLQGGFQANSGLILALPQSEIGISASATSFNFGVGTLHAGADGDFAPNTGLFAMSLQTAAATTTSATTTSATTTTTAATTTTTQKPAPKPKPKAKAKPKPKCVKWGKKHGKRVCVRYAKPKHH